MNDLNELNDSNDFNLDIAIYLELACLHQAGNLGFGYLV
jgi:hypothetical protein